MQMERWQTVRRVRDKEKKEEEEEEKKDEEEKDKKEEEKKKKKKKKKKKAVGRPGLQYLKQVDRNRAADRYRAMGRVACNSCRWKGDKQSEE